MKRVAVQIEVVKSYSADSMKPGFWHATSRGTPLPQQFTFDTEFSTAEINAALGRLREKCASSEVGCDHYNLIIMRDNGGVIYRLPLQDLHVTPDAKAVVYHPRDLSFAIDNYSVRVVAPK